MKTLKNFNTLSLILLTSGLMSCNENTLQPPASIKVADGFALKTLRGELQSQIGALATTQSLMTQIALTSQGQVVADSKDVNVSIRSYCSSEDRQVSKELSTTLRASYPFFELVPESLLLESVVNKTVWLCNFEFKAIDRNLNKHIFDIKNIPVQNTGEGFISTLLRDSIPTTVVSDAPLAILESELERYSLVSDGGSADQMALQCDHLNWPLLGKDTNFQTLNQLQKENYSLKTLLENPIQLCRVYIYRGNQIVGLSPLLRLVFDQGLKDGQVSVIKNNPTHYGWHFENRPHTPLHLWTVNLANTSTYKRQFHLDFSNLQTLPVSFIGMNPQKTPWMPQKSEAFIQLPEGALILSEGFQNWTIELLSGQTAQVNIFLRLSHQCPNYPIAFIDFAALIRNENLPRISQIILSERNLPMPINSYETYFPEVFLNNSLPRNWDQAAGYKHYLEFNTLTEVDACTYTRL